VKRFTLPQRLTASEQSTSPKRFLSPQRSPSSLPATRIGRIRTWAAHAFAVEASDAPFDDSERKLADRLAGFVVRRRMTTPALMALESSRPLGFIGSQVLVFLAPFASLLFSTEEYERLTRLVEKRRGVDLVIDAIVARENERANG
jgi:hypothetical protein